MKPGIGAEPEVGPRVEARLARPAGVALLGGCVRIAGAGYESGRFAREHPFAGRPEFRPQADVRIVKAVIGVWRRVPQRVMLERGLTKNGQRIGKPVLHVSLRVDAALADRRIAAPGRAEARPAIEGCDQLPASLRQRPGAAKGAGRRADDRRERACGDPRTPKLQAGAGQERAPQRSSSRARFLRWSKRAQRLEATLRRKRARYRSVKRELTPSTEKT